MKRLFLFVFILLLTITPAVASETNNLLPNGLSWGMDLESAYKQARNLNLTIDSILESSPEDGNGLLSGYCIFFRDPPPLLSYPTDDFVLYFTPNDDHPLSLYRVMYFFGSMDKELFLSASSDFEKAITAFYGNPIPMDEEHKLYWETETSTVKLFGFDSDPNFHILVTFQQKEPSL